MKRTLIFLLIIFIGFVTFSQEKPIITVLDFKIEGGVSRSEMRTLISLLSSALFQTKKYTVLDVSERESLLKEMEFSVGDCSDESCQLEIGRLLSAEAVVIGTLGKFGTKYILSSKLLETETTRTINTADGIYSNLDEMVEDIIIVAGKLASSHKVPEEEIAKVTEEKDEKDEIAHDIVKDERKEEVADIKEVKKADYIEPKVKEKQTSLKNYISVGARGGPAFTIGDAMGEVFGMVITPLMHIDYNLNMGFGVLGFGIASGMNLKKTPDRPDENTPPEEMSQTVSDPYTLNTIPLGIHLKYETNFLNPVFISFGIIGGLGMNMFDYWNEESWQNTDMSEDDRTFFKPLASASLGIGYTIAAFFKVAVTADFFAVFYDDYPYYAGMPALQVELCF